MVVEPGTAAVAVAAWAGNKLLGPTVDALGDDLKKLYQAGRDRLISRAIEKVKDINDGKRANLRVARDILWNGAFSESTVCVEYYAGLLAASRSMDGLDDETAPFVDVVKSLASRQLKLHYNIYRSIERIREENHARGNNSINVALIEVEEVFVAGIDPHKSALDLQVLKRNGLISEFNTDSTRINQEGQERLLFYCMVWPTTFGTMLYAAAHNQLEWWQAFGSRHFGEIRDVEPPEFYGSSLKELLGRLPGDDLILTDARAC